MSFITASFENHSVYENDSPIKSYPSFNIFDKIVHYCSRPIPNHFEMVSRPTVISVWRMLFTVCVLTSTEKLSDSSQQPVFLSTHKLLMTVAIVLENKSFKLNFVSDTTYWWHITGKPSNYFVIAICTFVSNNTSDCVVDYRTIFVIEGFGKFIW